MQQLITVQGLVATTPRHLITQDGLPITSFRIASVTRTYNKELGKYVDGETNWYTVSAFKQLAINSASAVSKGDRIVVSGKIRIRDWDSGDRAGTSVEIEAETMGHDLAYGTSTFNRTVMVRETAEEPVHSCDCGRCDK